MIRELFVILSSLFLPSTWRDPYKDSLRCEAQAFLDLVTPGEAPVDLPPNHFGD